MTNNAKEAIIREYANWGNAFVKLDMFCLILNVMKVSIKCCWKYNIFDKYTVSYSIGRLGYFLFETCIFLLHIINSQTNFEQKNWNSWYSPFYGVFLFNASTYGSLITVYELTCNLHKLFPYIEFYVFSLQIYVIPVHIIKTPCFKIIQLAKSKPSSVILQI